MGRPKRTSTGSLTFACEFLPRKRPEGRVKYSTSWIRWLCLGGTMGADGGTLRDSFEHHVTVSNFTAPVAEREWMDPAHAAAVTKDVAVFGDLQQERPSDFALTVCTVGVLHQKDASFVIELDFAIDKIGRHHLNRLAACFLRNHVDRFLRKRVP